MDSTRLSFAEILKVIVDFITKHERLSFGIFVIVIIIIGIILNKIYEKKARKVREILSYRGFTNLPESSHNEIISTLRAFSLFNKGHDKKMTNLLLKETNIGKIYIFDYGYSESFYSSSASLKTKLLRSERTVVYFYSNLIDLPQFTIEPGGLLAKNVGHVPDYLKFEENPKFSKRYIVWGNNKDEIKKLFNNTVITFFLENEGFYAAGDKDKLIIYRDNIIKPDNIEQFLEKSMRLFNILR